MQVFIERMHYLGRIRIQSIIKFNKIIESTCETNRINRLNEFLKNTNAKPKIVALARPSQSQIAAYSRSQSPQMEVPSDRDLPRPKHCLWRVVRHEDSNPAILAWEPTRNVRKKVAFHRNSPAISHLNNTEVLKNSVFGCISPHGARPVKG